MVAVKYFNPLKLPSVSLFNKKELPKCAGIYFVIESDRVIYIGQALSLVLRWQNHERLKEIHKRGTNIRLAWLECAEESLLPVIETALIEWFKPELNKYSTGLSVKRESQSNSEDDRRVITLRLTDEEWLQLEEYSKKVARAKNEIIREMIRSLPKQNV